MRAAKQFARPRSEKIVPFLEISLEYAGLSFLTRAEGCRATPQKASVWFRNYRVDSACAFFDRSGLDCVT